MSNFPSPILNFIVSNSTTIVCWIALGASVFGVRGKMLADKLAAYETQAKTLAGEIQKLKDRLDDVESKNKHADIDLSYYQQLARDHDKLLVLIQRNIDKLSDVDKQIVCDMAEMSKRRIEQSAIEHLNLDQDQGSLKWLNIHARNMK